MPNLRKIEAAVPAIREKKKVAAYARVSMQSERMLHSLSAQVSYYSGLIQKNPDWEYAGVYADDFISGTNTVKRDEFKRIACRLRGRQDRHHPDKEHFTVCQEYGGSSGNGAAFERLRR